MTQIALRVLRDCLQMFKNDPSMDLAGRRYAESVELAIEKLEDQLEKLNKISRSST